MNKEEIQKVANKKRTVIRANSDQAEQFLTDYENKYIPAIEKACQSIKKIGVTPTWDKVVHAIVGNFEPLEEAYRELLSPSGRAVMEDIFTESIHSIKSQFEQLFTGTVGNNWTGGLTYGTFEELTNSRDKYGRVPLNSVSLIQFFLITEDGVPIMSEYSREAILDAFKDYTK